MNKLIVAAVCLAAPLAGLAAEPRYTYVEGGYVALDLDDFDADGDGFGVGGSLALNERVFLTADYANLDMDFGIDVSTFEVGIGGNLPMSDDLHLVGIVGYGETEVDTSVGDAEDDGYSLAGGFRWMTTPQLELNGFLNYVDLDDSGDDTSLSVGALYNVTPDLAIGAGVDIGDDTTGYEVGLRYYFPTLN